MANSLDWNVCYYGKDFLSYLLVVSYGSMSAWRVTRIIPKANNDMTQVNPGKIMLKYRKLPLIISSPTPEIRSTPLPNPLRRRGVLRISGDDRMGNLVPRALFPVWDEVVE